jgi:double-strand break repair protein MRE11
MKILATGDNHLGLKKRNPSWSEDAFLGLIEQLDYSRQSEADLVLFLGDLFDKREPSLTDIQKCRVILEKTIRKKKWSFLEIGETLWNLDWHRLENERSEYLNSLLRVIDLDQKEKYLHNGKGVIALGIYGNHDRPNIDGVSSIGLLNQMGYMMHLKEAVRKDRSLYIRPVLFKKGQTHVAVYGLNAEKELKITQMCEQGSIEFEEPPEIIESVDEGYLYRYSDKAIKREIERKVEMANFGEFVDRDQDFNFGVNDKIAGPHWVKILLVHQNKYRGDASLTFYPEILPMTFNVVLWGNEHECIPNLIRPFHKINTMVLFPGSSVKVTTKLQEKKPKCKCKFSIIYSYK